MDLNCKFAELALGLFLLIISLMESIPAGISAHIDITNCSVTQWAEWSECSNACGRGMRQRTRNVIPSYRLHSFKFAKCPLLEAELCSSFEGCSNTGNINGACLLKFERGSCGSDHLVWSFNRDTAVCEQARYSGCGGNANRFLTREDCNRQCLLNICSLPFNSGFCSSTIPVWTYNHDKDMCQPALYSGCLGNANRFQTKGECEWRCLNKETCNLKFDTGPCRGSIPVWTFNAERNVCEKTFFGGCLGNMNRFLSEEDCRQRCQKEDTCAVSFNAGPCTTFTQVWTYNPDRKRCEEAVYGGCLGNSNNFKTKQECDKRCKNKDSCSYEINECSSPVTDTKWTYDFINKQCIQTFNSCSSNPNTFVSKGECDKVCRPVSSKEICSLHFDAGPCNALVYVWAYNSTTRKCEERQYGGCEGNENRFSGEHQCRQTCLLNSTN